MTLRKNLVQFTECCQRFLPLPLFVCGVGLPVVSPFNAVSSFLDQLVEQVDRLLPLAFVQRSGALFIKPIGAFTLAFLTLLFAVLFLLYFFLILSLSLALALLFFLRLARLVLVVVVVVPALCPLRGLFLRCALFNPDVSVSGARIDRRIRPAAENDSRARGDLRRNQPSVYGGRCGIAARHRRVRAGGRPADLCLRPNP